MPEQTSADSKTESSRMGPPTISFLTGSDSGAQADHQCRRWQARDLAGEAKPDLVRFEGLAVGAFERNDKDTWGDFVPFHALPNVNWRDPNLRIIDLTGDNLADILIPEQQSFTRYSSLGETGCAPSERSTGN